MNDEFYDTIRDLLLELSRLETTPRDALKILTILEKHYPTLKADVREAVEKYDADN